MNEQQGYVGTPAKAPELMLTIEQINKSLAALEDSIHGLEVRLQPVMMEPGPTKQPTVSMADRVNGQPHSTAVIQLKSIEVRTMSLYGLVEEIKARLET